jgi:hypothetical protein
LGAQFIFGNGVYKYFGSPVRCRQIGGGVDHYVITGCLRSAETADQFFLLAKNKKSGGDDFGLSPMVRFLFMCERFV